MDVKTFRKGDYVQKKRDHTFTGFVTDYVYVKGQQFICIGEKPDDRVDNWHRAVDFKLFSSRYRS